MLKGNKFHTEFVISERTAARNLLEIPYQQIDKNQTEPADEI